jgi:hypothetical protein
MLIDVLIAPLAHRIRWRGALVWTAYPIAYLVYTLIRGPIDGLVPVSVSRPRNSGYGRVAIMCGDPGRIRRGHLAPDRAERLAAAARWLASIPAYLHSLASDSKSGTVLQRLPDFAGGIMGIRQGRIARRCTASGCRRGGAGRPCPPAGSRPSGRWRWRPGC